MPDDADLLRQYVAEGSEPAFRALVERHIPLVQATSRRILNGDLHLAQDVTQQVFTDLARKAATLKAGVILSGWLHRHTCFTAAKAVRTEQRRRARERTAMEMNAVNDIDSSEAHWLQLAPVLDDALNRLSPDDRDAIILRYFERRDLRSVGTALGVSDDTAQKRLARSLEKLRKLLIRSGATVASAAVLDTTLKAGPLAQVPASLAANIAGDAMSNAAAANPTHLPFENLKTLPNLKSVFGFMAIAALWLIAIFLSTHKTVNASFHPVTAQSPTSKKLALVPSAAITASQVAAPRVPPATQHDSGPIANTPPNQPETITIPILPNSEPIPVLPDNTPVPAAVLVEGISISSHGGISGSGTFIQPSPVLGNVTLSSGSLKVLTSAFPLGGDQPAILSGFPSGPAQVRRNDDGTMTLTWPDGTTLNMPMPDNPTTLIDNGDGTAAMTMLDGTTQTVTINSEATTEERHSEIKTLTLKATP